MNCLALLPLLAMPVLAVIIHSVPDLDSLQWNSRVILLFAPGENDPQLQNQEHRLEAEQKALDERDIKVFALTGTSGEVRTLRDRFHVADSRFVLLLVGKDGGEKLRKEHTIASEEIFQIIDRMPMRRDEMNRKK